jgi:hypothetical protein
MDEETCKKIIINPPPLDNRCECCRRHIDELKPYGGPGDPLVGDFTGQLLVKTHHYDFPECKNPYDLSGCLTKTGLIDKQKFIEKYSKEDLILFYEIESMNIISAYWLCRDCILIEDRDEFCKKCYESHEAFLKKEDERKR